MTNKTFLIFLLAGVSYTAYNAAAVSENFAISTTIDHEITLGSFRAASTDAELDVFYDLNMGTIVINPAATELTGWMYDRGGAFDLVLGDAVVSADNLYEGGFDANIPNPEACDRDSSCGGLSITGNDGSSIYNIFGGNDRSNVCDFRIRYFSGTTFAVTTLCTIFPGGASKITAGPHEGRLTISYNPE
ncbi:MAG: hypothetical protein IJ689_03815 [Alphaproteobacteria bacterium]|nr:hypothetical protein [Alphaproteobacteria bacterium]